MSRRGRDEVWWDTHAAARRHRLTSGNSSSRPTPRLLSPYRFGASVASGVRQRRLQSGPPVVRPFLRFFSYCEGPAWSGARRARTSRAPRDGSGGEMVGGIVRNEVRERPSASRCDAVTRPGNGRGARDLRESCRGIGAPPGHAVSAARSGRRSGRSPIDLSPGGPDCGGQSSLSSTSASFPVTIATAWPTASRPPPAAEPD